MGWFMTQSCLTMVTDKKTNLRKLRRHWVKDGFAMSS